MLELLTVNIKAALNYKLVYEDMNWGSGKEYHFLYHDLNDYTIIKKEIYNWIIMAMKHIKAMSTIKRSRW